MEATRSLSSDKIELSTRLFTMEAIDSSLNMEALRQRSPAETSEEDLELGSELRRLVAGDLSALDSIWSRWARDLYGFALWKTGVVEDAEDIVQDVFIRLASLTSRRLDISRPRAYLFSMVRHAAIDVLRRRARRERLQTVPDFVDGSGSLERAVEAGTLSRSIQELPPEQREVLYLRYFAELTFREIGAATGVPVFTAASRCRLGILRLRKLMGLSV